MAIEVMNRVEKKFLLDSCTYLKLQNIIGDYMELDSFNKIKEFYTISNLYLDTPDNHLIRTSTEKPRYKEKLRLRAYGVPTDSDFVFLEIKKKYKGVVNKRRTKLLLPEAYEFIETGKKPFTKEYMNKQVLNELEYCLNIYDLSPKLYLAYDRKAYFGENSLRVTFDTNIRTRRYDLRLEKGDYGTKLIDSDLWLMEIKAEKAIPIWLANALTENKVYSKSFSKYGTEYKGFLKGGEEKCLNPYSTQEQKWQQSQQQALSPRLA